MNRKNGLEVENIAMLLCEQKESENTRSELDIPTKKELGLTSPREPTRRTMPVEATTLNALVSQCDGLGYGD
ncbi:hypothetical protein Tco_0300787 [Tanacetum coccineum]